MCKTVSRCSSIHRFSIMTTEYCVQQLKTEILHLSFQCVRNDQRATCGYRMTVRESERGRVTVLNNSCHALGHRDRKYGKTQQ